MNKKTIITGLVVFGIGFLSARGIDVKMQKDPEEVALYEWAMDHYAKQMTVDCPAEGCDAKVGELCDTPGVWIHVERFSATEN